MKSVRARTGVVVGLVVVAAVVVWWSLAGNEGAEFGRMQEDERARQEQLQREHPAAQRRESAGGRMPSAS